MSVRSGRRERGAMRLDPRLLIGLVLVAGLVPLLIFWVERVVVRKVQAENADELVPAE